MRPAEDLSVDNQSCVHLSILNGHTGQRQFVRSIVRHRKDARRLVTTVTNVTDDAIEDNGITSVDYLTATQMNRERHF